MYKTLFISAFMLFLSLLLQAQIAEKSTSQYSIGEVKTIFSAVLQENRTLNIYLPEKYEVTKKYPVIYLLDGSSNEDFLHVVGLVQFFHLQFQMPETLVVGIANVDRKRDFTFPTTIEDLKKEYPTTGKSEHFIRFLEHELIPFVEKNYNTNDTKYLIGQSLGGLLATEILCTKTELFSHYLITSPSLWWDDQSLVLKIDSWSKNYTFPKHKYVYIGVGEEEHKIMVKDATKFYTLLSGVKNKNLQASLEVLKNENHATVLHNSLYKAFLKLFPYQP